MRGFQLKRGCHGACPERSRGERKDTTIFVLRAQRARRVLKSRNLSADWLERLGYDSDRTRGLSFCLVETSLAEEYPGTRFSVPRWYRSRLSCRVQTQRPAIPG